MITGWGWTFRETKRKPQGKYLTVCRIDNCTIADETISNGTSLYVRGRVSQGYNQYIHFRTWHKATQTEETRPEEQD